LTVHVIVPAATAELLRIEPISPFHGLRLTVEAGVQEDLDDIEREDDQVGQGGYEDADDAAFWGIIRAAQDDACGICGFWRCRCLSGTAPVALTTRTPVGGSGQCSVCGGWFDGWNGGVCDACRSIGY
jgi:hypothetical protein